LISYEIVSGIAFADPTGTLASAFAITGHSCAKAWSTGACKLLNVANTGRYIRRCESIQTYAFISCSSSFVSHTISVKSTTVHTSTWVLDYRRNFTKSAGVIVKA
jgi:hypothetical protein